MLGDQRLLRTVFTPLVLGAVNAREDIRDAERSGSKENCPGSFDPVLSKLDHGRPPPIHITSALHTGVLGAWI